MLIFTEEKKETCFDGSEIYEYICDMPVDESFMRKLAQGGQLSFYPEFTRPYFKIVTKDDIQIKGILGDKSFEAVFPKSALDRIKKEFIERNFESYSEP